MNAPSPMLALDSVSRRFGEVAALDGVSLDILPGQVVCLVGHSGCGKSTLLRAIAGVESIDGGRIVIDGVTVSGDGIFVEPEHRRVGFMFQDYALFPHLSVRQNVGFGLARMNRADRDARVDTIMERIGITALADRFPHMLSGGEQQRVALARALAPQPGVLLMDEPFSNLDRGLRDKVRKETLSLIRSLGITAVIVTHDPEEALAVGDMVALMQKGRLIEAGTGEMMFKMPRTAYAAAFFSQVNRIPAELAEGALRTPIGTFPVTAATPNKPLVYVRPQAIRLGETGAEALVVGRHVLGELEELSLQVEGLNEPLIVRSTNHYAVAEGQKVRLSVDARDVMVFAEEAI